MKNSFGYELNDVIQLNLSRAIREVMLDRSPFLVTEPAIDYPFQNNDGVIGPNNYSRISGSFFESFPSIGPDKGAVNDIGKVFGVSEQKDESSQSYETSFLDINDGLTFNKSLKDSDWAPTSAANEAISTLGTNWRNVSSDNFTQWSFFQCESLDLTPKTLSLCVLLILFAISTIFGNMLVIIAIARERYLHTTVTNYFIMSLAVADCLVGALVMPFSALYDSFKCWFFGPDFCDVWHSFDVLASTASILNLCVISMDRYWAVTDPLSYPSRMSPKRAYAFIALVWVCSSIISFPAIVWWRLRSQPHPEFQCHFTEDLPYLFFSSTISFYGPLLVMVFTYLRIYKAATEQTRSLRLGQKMVSSMGNGDMELTLRIHRGGVRNASSYSSASSARSQTQRRKQCSCSLTNDRSRCYCVHQNGQNDSEMEHSFNALVPNEERDHCPLDSSPNSSTKLVSRNIKHFSISRKLCKFAKEKKAAKTLGIVMGVFIICWLPFFVNNLRLGLCGESCTTENDAYVTYIVTWLGWINSAMNPVIYACWARDFRRAFIRILCHCCPRRCKRRYQTGWRSGIAQIVVTPVVSTLNTPFLKAATDRSFAAVPKAK